MLSTIAVILNPDAGLGNQQEDVRRAVAAMQDQGMQMRLIRLAPEKPWKVQIDTLLAELVTAFNTLLDYNKKARFAIEPKPNEPMDHMYIPSVGHALAIGQATNAPSASTPPHSRTGASCRGCSSAPPTAT